MANYRTLEEERLMTQIEKDHDDMMSGNMNSGSSGNSGASIGQGSSDVSYWLITIGLVILGTLVYGIFDNFETILVVATKAPLFFFTHPFWLILTISLCAGNFYRRKEEKLYQWFFKTVSMVLVTISLPMITVLLAYILLAPIGFMLGVRLPLGLFDNAISLYIASYGIELAPQLLHYYMEDYLGFKFSNGLMMFSVNVLYLIVIAVGFLASYNLYFQVIMTRVSGNTDAEFSDISLDVIGLAIVIAFNYAITIPLRNSIGDLPSGISTLIVWSVLLFPFFGIRLAIHNRYQSKAHKMGRIFTYYYLLFWMAIVAFMYTTTKYDLAIILAPLCSFWILIRSLR